MRTRQRILSTLVITCVATACATLAQAQSTGPQTAIVGSWMGTSGGGDKVLASFTADGIAFGSVQGQISLRFPSLTTPHGAWTYLGGRQFTSTSVGLLYELQTGKYQGFIKIRVLLMVSEDGDQVSGTDKVQIFDADGNLVNTFPEGAVHYTRIKVEPFN